MNLRRSKTPYAPRCPYCKKDLPVNAATHHQTVSLEDGLVWRVCGTRCPKLPEGQTVTAYQPLEQRLPRRNR